MRIEAKEKDALIFAVGITVFVVFIMLVVLNSSIKSINSKISYKKAEYEKALALYGKIKHNNSSKHKFNSNILLFVQRLETLNGIKTKIVSVNSSGVDNGARIRIVGLNLPQLIGIFKTVENYGNIEIVKFTLKRDFSNSNLVDLSMVLRKKL